MGQGFACMQATPLKSAADTGDLSNLTSPGASIVETYIKPEDESGVVLPQSEDCLTLNVWTEPQSGEKAKAVLVWIQYVLGKL
jgi:carboxylesterase type B